MIYINKKQIFNVILSVFLGVNASLYANWYENDKNEKEIIVQQHYNSIPSTQILSREEAEKIIKGEKLLTSNEWRLNTADEQTGGIGQNSRAWSSPNKVNIYATYSFLWPKTKENLLFHFPQVVTLSMAESMEKLGFSPQIKWINDLLLSEKKMCGILCENRGIVQDTSHFVVLMGIGLNVNMSKEQCTLDQPVTSLKLESNKDWDKGEILALMNQNLLKNMRILVNKGFKPLFPGIQKRMAYIGKEITVDDDTSQYTGTFEGIDENGAMILRVNKEQKILHNGRIIKKPLYIN